MDSMSSHHMYSASFWNKTKKVEHVAVCKHWQVYKINAVGHQMKQKVDSIETMYSDQYKKCETIVLTIDEQIHMSELISFKREQW
jgi:hypothetical protein